MELYCFIIIVSIFSMLILMSLAYTNGMISKKMKKTMIIASLLVILAAIFEFLGEVFDGSSPLLRIPHIIVKFLELSISPLIPYVIAEAFYKMKSRKLVISILSINCIMHFVSIFLGITFYIDINNKYHVCNMYWIFYFAIVVGLLYLVKSVILFAVDFQSTNKITLFMILFFVICGCSVQIIDESIKIVWVTVSLSTILLYVYCCNLILKVDELTGVLDRRTFENHVHSNHKIGGVLYFDVNDFKMINDIYGHQFGDKCLKEVAIALKHVYGKHGLCYRVGGDEFCVILGKKHYSIDKLKDEFNEILALKTIDGNKFPKVAIGYSEYDSDTMKIYDAVSIADQNMYVDKKNIKEVNGSINN